MLAVAALLFHRPFALAREFASHVSSPTGNCRTRIRASSKMTMLPSCNAVSTTGRFARSIANCCSGFRSVLRLNKIMEGFRPRVSANTIPKSVSAETRIRSSKVAASRTCLSVAEPNPYSRTCLASWPFWHSRAARIGEARCQ